MSTRTKLPSERQERIRRILERERYVSVRELADRVDVSDMTIRRDLEALAERGAVKRVFGGAQVADAPTIEQVYAERMLLNRKAKERIAAAALAFVRDGDTVALDGSTTSVYFGRRLKGRNVVIVTNSLLIAQELADADMEVVLPGGVLRSRTQCLVGAAAERSLGAFNVDTVFLSAGALHPDHGLTDTHDLEAALKRRLLEIGGRAVALVDASKFGKRALHPLVALDALDDLVTDMPPPDALRAALEASAVRVEVAGG